jgi:DNA-binding CsgD family transcriptional regulator
MSKSVQILIAETSEIIIEGLLSILSKLNNKIIIDKVSELSEIDIMFTKRDYNLVIINPSFIQNNLKAYKNLKKQNDSVAWVGIVYSYFEPQFLKAFDGIINISEPSHDIISNITNILNSNNQKDSDILDDVLSDREIDVLKLMATGMANKEIADKLNISINTVITHRKNISQKTGIKTISGLTIYAVVKKYIALDSINI